MPRPLPPAHSPVTDDDATIAAALEHASVPVLMMSLVHMSGDSSLLDGPIRPKPIVMGESQGFLSEAEKAEVRAHALEVIRTYRDSGCKLPPAPSPATIHRMMEFLVGGEISPDYVPMMLEEMALDGRDARDVDWTDVPRADRERLHVVVIGAGMSGLLTAIRLGDAGIPYTVIEKNDAVGGTWYENAYPGCRVDIGNHFYCYSFEPSHDWPEYFSQRDELHAYFERCATKYGVREHVRFGTEVVSADWDEAATRWRVRVRARGGREETLAANAVVSALGQLNRPRIPEIPGRERFRRPAFHSARWEGEHALEGRRIAVVGTGASALQIVPELAKVAGTLRVFQRSPAWVIGNPNYHRSVSDGKKWCLEHLPYYARWYRFLIFWPGSDGLMPSLRIDPAWEHPERSVNATNDAMRQIFTQWIESQVGDDPELLAKVLPGYPPFIKRMLQDDGSWLQALKRPNVELVTDPIRELTEDAIVCESGAVHPQDVIVWATGFHANRFLWPIDVRGRGGVSLGELWGDEPRAYLGISVPGFPNLFCLYGPGTNLAHAGSIIFHSECQVRYVMGCLKALLAEGKSAMECRQDVADDYARRFDAEHEGLVWSHPGERSWYKNAAGRVTTTSPWRLLDYWRWTREPDLADYELR